MVKIVLAFMRTKKLNKTFNNRYEKEKNLLQLFFKYCHIIVYIAIFFVKNLKLM